MLSTLSPAPAAAPVSQVPVNCFVHLEADLNVFVAKSDRHSLVAVGAGTEQVKEQMRGEIQRECPFNVVPVFHWCAGIVNCTSEVDPSGAGDLYLVLERDDQGLHARSLDALFHVRQLSEHPEELCERLRQWAARSDQFQKPVSRLLLFLSQL